MRAIQVKQYVNVPHPTLHTPPPPPIDKPPLTPTSPQGPDDLTVTSIPDPTPSPDEYLIAIHATATNFFDLLQIRGKYQHQPPLPWTAGSEFSGVVLRTPSSSSSSTSSTPKFSIGDRVFGATQGGYATLIAARESHLRPVPAGWSFFDAAGLFVTAPTSYAALVTRARVRKGDYVLVHAAAGGVGLAAVQVARAFGATVIATAGSAHKLAVARAFGADHGVDYRDAAWPELVKALTPQGRGVDIVFDPVGLIAPSMKCIAWNGRLLVIGFAAGEIERVAMNRVLLKNISIVGLHWGVYASVEPETVEEVWKGLFELMRDGKFRGTGFTDREFVGLESVPGALRALGERGTWGKVVVRLPQEREGSKI